MKKGSFSSRTGYLLSWGTCSSIGALCQLSSLWSPVRGGRTVRGRGGKDAGETGKTWFFAFTTKPTKREFHPRNSEAPAVLGWLSRCAIILVLLTHERQAYTFCLASTKVSAYRLVNELTCTGILYVFSVILYKAECSIPKIWRRHCHRGASPISHWV